jgi:hypothetical protein
VRAAPDLCDRAIRDKPGVRRTHPPASAEAGDHDYVTSFAKSAGLDFHVLRENTSETLSRSGMNVTE